MAVVISVPAEYGYVIISIVITVFIQFYLGYLVGVARKKHGVQYPAMYDSNKLVFNCVQRGHQNMLETHYITIASALVSGFQFPKLTAILVIGYGVGRILYAQGYATGDPAKRYKGGFNLLCLFGLVLLNIIEGLSLLGFSVGI